MEEQISLFVDNAGRYILGVIECYTPDNKFMMVKNPAIIVVNQGQNGQIQIQTIPYFFKELLAPGVEKTTWKFPVRSTAICTNSGENLSEALKAQYHKAVNSVAPQQQSVQPPKVVKLFDE